MTIVLPTWIEYLALGWLGSWFVSHAMDLYRGIQHRKLCDAAYHADKEYRRRKLAREEAEKEAAKQRAAERMARAGLTSTDLYRLRARQGELSSRLRASGVPADEFHRLYAEWESIGRTIFEATYDKKEQ